ncbi:uncharacterized protein [Drosophila bipectinata]|uniref:uncharacterized protein n=1 Tax=Drosophila bipectinata TaxID=42026 RepID=UPI001C89E2EC|nr:uncharacterized protein LOC108119596 [Drosophila bipectinata]
MSQSQAHPETVVTQLRHFITRSSYEGAWDKQVNVMDGFGSYRYPDGSEYRGRFQQGQFHGFGHLRLAQPYKFTIKGEFEHGRLVTIEDMWFSDGLHVKGTFSNSGLDCADWEYLTPQDRRYHPEKRYGQQPVGPTSFLTAKLLPRVVPKGCYDAEEGIYNAETGWLTERPAPFTGTTYVGCQQEKDWIMRNCRKARSTDIIEPSPSMCRSVIANNLATEREQMQRTAIYAPRGKVDRDRYYHKLDKPRAGARNSSPGDQNPLQASTLRQKPLGPDDPARATDLCVRAYARMLDKQEQEQQRLQKQNPCQPKKDPVARPREWTSTSDVRNPQSGGESSCESDSFGECMLGIKISDDYLSANIMGKKKVGDNFNVVQSNLIRRTSYMDMTRSIFEL